MDTTTTERRKYTPEELAAIVEAHGKWRRGEGSGARADLADANLADADLARADLADANLAGADLADANLARANLAGANLARADLADADLAGANLAGADLADANLAGAYLAGAYLAGADLADADLAGANLAGANLADANLAGANLAGADLAYAYLADADLADADLADADLADADLAGARNVPQGIPAAEQAEPYQRATTEEDRRKRRAARMAKFRKRNPDVPVVENLDARICDAIGPEGKALEMGSWHSSCGTTHCRAGWAITLAGEAGKKLEEQYGPRIAGRMIYLASTGRVPHFFATNARALDDIRACAAEQSPPTASP